MSDVCTNAWETFYKPHRVVGIYATVRTWCSCVHNHSDAKKRSHHKLFLSESTFQYIKKGKLEPFIKNKIIQQTCSSHRQSVQRADQSQADVKKTAMSSLASFWSIERFIFGILSRVLADKCPQLVSKLFESVCSSLEVNNMTIFKYIS